MSQLIMPQASAAVGTPLSLAIKNTSELDQAHAHILLFGETKSGKTTCATSIVEPELIRVVSTQPEEHLSQTMFSNLRRQSIRRPVGVSGLLPA